MPDQYKKYSQLLEKRNGLVSNLFRENEKQLRILQQQSGFEILFLSSPKPNEIIDSQIDFRNQLESCRARTSSLERDLADIDEQLEALSKREKMQ